MTETNCICKTYLKNHIEPSSHLFITYGHHNFLGKYEYCSAECVKCKTNYLVEGNRLEDSDRWNWTNLKEVFK